MHSLNFPSYPLKIKSSENKHFIFDIIRKKYVALQPEEWVRQHLIHYLIQDKGYPISLINVEKKLQLNQIIKRYDLVIFNPDGTILMIAECKAPSVGITQETFNQIARYNYILNASILLITNGIQHVCYKTDAKAEKYSFLEDIPSYIR